MITGAVCAFAEAFPDSAFCHIDLDPFIGIDGAANIQLAFGARMIALAFSMAEIADDIFWRNFNISKDKHAHKS